MPSRSSLALALALASLTACSAPLIGDANVKHPDVGGGAGPASIGAPWEPATPPAAERAAARDMARPERDPSPRGGVFLTHDADCWRCR